MKRIDERDTMFARMGLVKGSWQYEDYYARNPDKLLIDEAIREKPNLCSPGTVTYDPVDAPIADANFAFLGDIRRLSEGEVNPERVVVSSEEMSKKLKGLSLLYGAKLAGICSMKDFHYYSHRGRHPEDYAQVVDETIHHYGIVFAVEMDQAMINRSPLISEVIETSAAYVRAATIGMQLAYYLRQLGYAARNHLDGYYLSVLPLVACDAGLGEIGRNGILTTQEFGSRVRLGLVTTELELIPDLPIDIGLQEFCEMCGKCSQNCPAQAIPSGQKQLIEDELRWQIVQEKCYNFWRHVGTDCGICISSCPYSQGMVSRPLHDEESIRQVLKQFEDQFGKRPFDREPPEWLK